MRTHQLDAVAHEPRVLLVPLVTHERLDQLLQQPGPAALLLLGRETSLCPLQVPASTPSQLRPGKGQILRRDGATPKPGTGHPEPGPRSPVPWLQRVGPSVVPDLRLIIPAGKRPGW